MTTLFARGGPVEDASGKKVLSLRVFRELLPDVGCASLQAWGWSPNGIDHGRNSLGQWVLAHTQLCLEQIRFARIRF
jgi:hypothetical protein